MFKEEPVSIMAFVFMPAISISIIGNNKSSSFLFEDIKLICYFLIGKTEKHNQASKQIVIISSIIIFLFILIP